MVTNSEDPIVSLCDRLMLEHPGLDQARLSRYLADINSWNSRIPLISRKTPIQVMERLVRQSVLLYDYASDQIAPHLAFRGLRIVDIGTGAGFPGIVWKLLQPDMSVTLVERNQKKATFLHRTVATLGLKDVGVQEGDALEIAAQPEFREGFDLAVTFAVGNLESVAPYVEVFLRPQGWYCTMRPVEEEVQPASVGKGLELFSASEIEFGRFCLYRKMD